MCGRFSFAADIKQVMEMYDVLSFDFENHQKRYNIAPSQLVLSVINDGNQNRLGYLQWGLIPSWASDPKIGYKLINARAETLVEKPSFRNAYKKRRCVIPADSFYE